MRMLGSVVFNDKNRRFEIDCEPHVSIRLKRIFAKIRPLAGVNDTGSSLGLSATPENAFDLQWFLQRYPMDIQKASLMAMEDRAKKWKERETLVDRVLRQKIVDLKFPLKLPPREYQGEATAMWLTVGGLLLADDVGLGKTMMAIAGLTDPRLRPALVVTLTHLPFQWAAEVSKFTDLKAHILRKSTPYDITKDGYLPDVIISNYHKLDNWHETLAPLLKSVVFDEVQELRHKGTKKYTAAEYIANRVDFRLGLSATPIYNYGGEMWNVFNVLQPDSLGDWDEFQREWCEWNEQKPKIKDTKAFGLHTRDSGLMLRRTRKEVGRELPPVTVVPHYIDANPDVIMAMESDAINLAKIILAQNEAFKGQKMRAAGEFDMKMRQSTGIAKAPFVAEFVKFLVESNDEPVVLFGWHRECFAKGTPVLMFSGEVRQIENVLKNELVMGPDSLPRTVDNLIAGRGVMYRITPTKGDPFVVSENHVLTLDFGEKYYRKRYGQPFEITVREFLKKDRSFRASALLYRTGVDVFEGSNDVLEPWLLGYWLGDGTSDLGCIEISTADIEVVTALAAVCERWDLELHVNQEWPDTTCKKYVMATKPPKTWGKNFIHKHFQSLGLHNNKHIPATYKTASRKARLELLAGLIDSDGHVSTVGKGATFTNKNCQLVSDVAFLARSLGYAAFIYPAPDNKTGKMYYNVGISGSLQDVPTCVVRKRAQGRLQQKRVLVTGFSVEVVGVADFYGFSLREADKRFLLGDFTVVHNCYNIWMEKLKELNPVLFTGSETAAQKEESKQKFQRGESKVMIISLRAGAGLDGLQGICNIGVFGELDWSPGVHEQCIGRIARDGQGNAMTIYYLISTMGSDPFISDILGVKKQQIEGIRDPDQDLVTKLQIESDYIKKLAEKFLADRKVVVPASVGSR